MRRVTAVLLKPNPTPCGLLWFFDSGPASSDPRSEVCTVAQTRPKPDFWWIASLILVAISLLGFGYMLWKYYGAGR